ncbi:hypothetical protein ACFQI7_09830 [Paenibacillus allorhizosphaerae]|uniref:Coat protein n=1 Tax=Paenibacillus allorhizosphaerae TaxID=2849866 RepID=A0ABM8VIR7_9BACL|nr:hypothetical protein [Paenibacillus allorhizosphaerae]CAG7644477.1 hypothetical protein PAECIP111802_03279 [Paenibacillus allorhizosphaerae]
MAIVKKKTVTKKPVKKIGVTAPKVRRRRIRQTLDRFHVIAVNANLVPVTTTGWTAVLTRGDTTETANFDSFGVARFNNLTTLTNVSYTLRVRNADGVQRAQRSVPADLEAIVIQV